MAKIPLRAYLKEIENFIEQGEIEQAVANAKNILRVYPKHIETYRLMGKAFLESQRYSEASDILQRILSVIPDDFVSQIGMSIIREDEGNLDAAIWHMERAYEVQPFNPAIQDELRRLYGRRDGSEPPKIRLTRGALVRMYARGELYPQAIAETRAALAEDPQRVDLQVLLARLYYQSGQKNDAAEVCSELIAKYPYCYEANRLLVEILPTTSRADEAPKFQQRINALDPYAAFTSPSAPTSQQVPDQAVLVEQYLWDATEEVSQAPDWTRTAGVAWEETQEENLPDWLNTLQPDTSTQSTFEPNPQESGQDDLSRIEEMFSGGEEGAGPESTGQSIASANIFEEESKDLFEKTQTPASDEDVVPDWMKEAGWKSSDRSAEEIWAIEQENTLSEEDLAQEQSEAASPAASAEAEELTPAEIPEWLQAMAPPQIEEPKEESDWSELFSAQESGKPQAEEREQPLSAAEEAPAGAGEEAQPAGGEEQDVPEWLAGFAVESTTTSSSETEQMPDWFTQLTAEQSQEPAGEQSSTSEVIWPETEEASTAGALEQQDDATPEWLKHFGAETGELAMPELAESESPDEEITEATAEMEETLTASDALPDWLKGFEAETEMSETVAPETPVSAETLAPPQAEGETLPEWLLEDTPSTQPPAAELQEMPVSSQTQAEAPEQPTLEEQALPGEMEMPDMLDMDATMAWLESLAARQGADEATLTTTPEERTETLPDWLTKEVETRPEGSIEAATPEAMIGEPVAEDKTLSIDSDFSADVSEVELETLPYEQDIQSIAAEISPTMPDATEPGLPAPIETDIPIPDELAPLPDWLAGLEEETNAVVAQQEEIHDAAEQTVEIPLGEDEAPTQPVKVSRGIAPEPEQAVEEAEEPAELPEWLRETENESPNPPAQTEELPAAEISETESTVPEFGNIDDAMAWLESLAARQGADEATLITPPDQRSETPPEWVRDEVESAAKEEVAAPAAQSLEIEEAHEEEALPDWLEGVIAPADEEKIPGPESVIDTYPEETIEESETLSWAAEYTAPEAQPSVESETEPALSGQPTEEAEPAAPEWLTGAATSEPEPASHEEIPDWLKRLETTPLEESTPASTGPEPEAQELDETSFEWINAPADDQAAPTQSLPDWLNVPSEAEEAAPAGEQKESPLPEWLTGVEEGEEAESLAVEETAEAYPVSYRAAWEPEEVQEQEQAKSEVPASSATGDISGLLALLNHGELEKALEGYNEMIQNDEQLDQIIRDLRDALYRYPVDISLWQALGDAYAHSDQLQDALDAYTKAEDLLR